MGKLYNKYRNWKNNLSRKADSAKLGAKRSRDKTFHVMEDEEAHVRALKHDSKSMSYSDKIFHWNACAATRMNSIREIDISSKQIIDLWPQYKMPDGYRLVNIYICIYMKIIVE